MLSCTILEVCSLRPSIAQHPAGHGVRESFNQSAVRVNCLRCYVLLTGSKLHIDVCFCINLSPNFDPKTEAYCSLELGAWNGRKLAGFFKWARPWHGRVFGKTCAEPI